MPVTERDAACRRLAFLDEYEQHVPLDKVIEAEEMKRAKELLTDSLALGQKAGYIDVAGTIVALSVGEIVGDTLYCHVEKARVDYAGLLSGDRILVCPRYAACRRTRSISIARTTPAKRTLRYSKMAYRPICLIEKYWVTDRLIPAHRRAVSGRAHHDSDNRAGIPPDAHRIHIWGGMGP